MTISLRMSFLVLVKHSNVILDDCRHTWKTGWRLASGALSTDRPCALGVTTDFSRIREILTDPRPQWGTLDREALITSEPDALRDCRRITKAHFRAEVKQPYPSGADALTNWQSVRSLLVTCQGSGDFMQGQVDKRGAWV